MSEYPTIFWDFEGTLGYREGGWGDAIWQAAESTVGALAPALTMVESVIHKGFPWHTPDVGHSYTNADAWWEHMAGVFRAALVRAGMGHADAQIAAGRVRDIYCAPDVWRCIDGASEALYFTSGSGWRNIILSNHIPELESIVRRLGIGVTVQTVVSSATVGWEKPHSEIFKYAREVAGSPSLSWMVGDNPIADGGFVREGVPCLLVVPERGFGPMLAAKMIVAAGAPATSACR